MSIQVRNLVNGSAPRSSAIASISTSPPAELVALLGPSGSGKPRYAHHRRLEGPGPGSVLFQGEDATFVDTRERNVGFVSSTTRCSAT